MPSFPALVRYLPDIVGMLLFVVGIAGATEHYSPSFLLCAWILIGLPLFFHFFHHLRHGHFLDEYFLITLAGGGAVAIGRYQEAVLVVLLYRLGDYLLTRIVARTQEAIRSLGNQSRGANTDDDDPTAATRVQSPVDRAQSRALVDQAAARKAPSERFITHFARWYTPILIAAAFLMTFLPPLLSADIPYTESVYRALSFLVIACPSALLIAIPIGWYAAVETASQQGILVKGADHLDTLSRADTILFGKTGTLTKGRYAVIEVLPVEGGMPKERFLHYAALAESQAAHPVAAAIRAAYGKPIPYDAANELTETPGKGVIAWVDEQEVAAGTALFLRELGVVPLPDATFGTTIHVALSRYYIGCVVVADELRDEVPAMIAALKKNGIRQMAVLSGDSEFMVRQTARAAGIAESWGALTPRGKLEKIEQVLATARGTVVFMGNDIDDALLLARADVGVSLGKMHDPITTEAADIVLTSERPALLYEALRLARRGRAVVGQNLFLVLAVKGTLLFLAAVGIASLWEVVFADTIAAIITILNASRLIAGKSVQQELTDPRTAS
ncbi:MAG TPA: HAD-IC family P-type ATPase [bacterium]|nr:HAD-IC family P-type ATPase [bacterium]